METVTGTAAGVPFTALPPDDAPPDGPAPLIVTWHMLDAPRTDAAFAAALPMRGVPAWRVHLGMPLCGARMVDGRLDAHVERAREDVLTVYLAPLARQAADEFPAALAALREQLPVGDGPVGLVGASIGGTVALRVLTAQRVPVGAVALVNPAIRIATAVDVVAGLLGEQYPWTAAARRVADELDLVAGVRELTAPPPLLLVNGEDDFPASHTDAADLAEVVRAGHAEVERVVVPGLAHPLADEPGLEPAPPWPATTVVDEHLTRWFRRQLAG